MYSAKRVDNKISHINLTNSQRPGQVFNKVLNKGNYIAFLYALRRIKGSVSYCSKRDWTLTLSSS